MLSANTVSMWHNFCEYDTTPLFMMWFVSDSAISKPPIRLSQNHRRWSHSCPCILADNNNLVTCTKVPYLTRLYQTIWLFMPDGHLISLNKWGVIWQHAIPKSFQKRCPSVWGFSWSLWKGKNYKTIMWEVLWYSATIEIEVFILSIKKFVDMNCEYHLCHMVPKAWKLRNRPQPILCGKGVKLGEEGRSAKNIGPFSRQLV